MIEKSLNYNIWSLLLFFKAWLNKIIKDLNRSYNKNPKKSKKTFQVKRIYRESCENRCQDLLQLCLGPRSLVENSQDPVRISFWVILAHYWPWHYWHFILLLILLIRLTILSYDYKNVNIDIFKSSKKVKVG